MLRVYDYDHPSDDDVPTPRGRTIAHANVCMITVKIPWVFSPSLCGTTGLGVV